MVENDFLVALKEAIARAGTQATLAKNAGISQSTISDYLNGRYSVGNMTVSVLLKIFADMQIDFFGGKTGNATRDLLRQQLLDIFDSLDDQGCVRMIAINAANFGHKLREETKK